MPDAKNGGTPAAEVTPPPEKLKLAMQAIEQIERQHGKGAILRFTDATPLQVEAISTGCLSLDAAVGVGGFPRGAYHRNFRPRIIRKNDGVPASDR